MVRFISIPSLSCIIIELNRVFSCVAADGGRDMAAMNAMSGAMMGGGMPGGPAPDFMKMFTAERENLDIVEHVWIADKVEQRLLDKYAKKATKL